MQSTTDEERILAILDEMNELMANGDFDGQRAQFADDPEVRLIGSDGWERFLGPTGLDAYFEVARKHQARGSFAWTSRSATVAGDVAWVYAEADFAMDLERERINIPYRLTLVLRRQRDGWRIIHYHGAQPGATLAP
jgi:ketosteroid isomerase-like protein